jgi:hypothetical protein
MRSGQVWPSDDERDGEVVTRAGGPRKEREPAGGGVLWDARDGRQTRTPSDPGALPDELPRPGRPPGAPAAGAPAREVARGGTRHLPPEGGPPPAPPAVAAVTDALFEELARLGGTPGAPAASPAGGATRGGPLPQPTEAMAPPAGDEADPPGPDSGAPRRGYATALSLFALGPLAFYHLTRARGGAGSREGGPGAPAGLRLAGGGRRRL